jgi:nucleoid-associated protein YgaU
MGLFSFLKNAGAKLFTKGAAGAGTAVAEAGRKARAEALKKAIADYGIEVNDILIGVDGDKVTVHGEVDSQEEKEKVVLILGNVEGVATVDDRLTVVHPKPEAQFYEVKKGDSLSKIAKKYYDDPMKYPVIFEANKPMLKDPNLIYPGQKLRIPPLEE